MYEPEPNKQINANQSEINQQELDSWLKLANVHWLGATLKAALIRKFKTPKRAFEAEKHELIEIKGFDCAKAERFLAERFTFEPACTSETLKATGIKTICFNSPDYPGLLREIPDPPIVLFVKGTLCRPDKPSIAIVGARRGTQLGYDIARDFAWRLAAAGFNIVSGLAIGIDTYAHLGALDANGSTTAVLANGLDVIYPRGNKRTREAILKNNAIISEFAPGVSPRPWFFPVRNRVISGMAQATLVVEANARSGSLITARLSAEQNREVYVVPSTDKLKPSDGIISLLQEGATAVVSPEEIIEHFASLLSPSIRQAALKNEQNLTDDEKKLLAQISKEPVSIDSLYESGWPRERLFSLLLQLEMRNYLVKLPGNRYKSNDYTAN